MVTERDNSQKAGLRSASSMVAPVLTGALRAAGGVAETVDGEECRNRECLGLEQREVREAWYTGLDAVDDVEGARLQRKREVRSHAHGDAEAAATRDRHGEAERDDVGQLPTSECSTARLELRRAARRSEDADAVAAAPESRGDARDMVVGLVRQRPRERRDETDPHPARF